MARAILYVFSGTGNTDRAAALLRREFTARGVAATVVRVRRPFPPAPSPVGFDYAGFGYPIHAFNTPEIFLDFVRTLPPAPGCRAFIFKTSGEPFWPNDGSSGQLLALLRKRGYTVALETHLLMPYNIVFRYPDGLVRQMHRVCAGLCRVMVSRLLAGERDRLVINPLKRATSWLFRIEWPGARFNGRLHRADPAHCTGCLRCVRACPTGNISVKDGLPVFDGRCALCMACAMGCPAGAVHIGLLERWRVNGPYDFQRILSGSDPGEYISAATRGYFRLFLRYFIKAEKAMAAMEPQEQGLETDRPG